MDNRKLVSWRLEKLEQNQQDMINQWLDAQSNIQLSITNMALHMIGHFGYVDIMNFSVQKELYTKLEAVPFEPPIIPVPSQKPVESRPAPVKEPKIEKAKSASTTVTEPLPKPVAEKPIDDPVAEKPLPTPVVEEPPITEKKTKDSLYEDLADDL